MIPQRRESIDRARRRRAGDRLIALVVAAAVCVLAAGPAAGAAVLRDGGGSPGGSGSPGGPGPNQGPGNDGPADRDADAPRPVATRPTGQPAPVDAADALAVQGLRVPRYVPLPTARKTGIATSFVPRPGCLVADVRLFERSHGQRRLVARRQMSAHGGRRASVHLLAVGLRPGSYEVAVRAGAGRATLGPAVVARTLVG
jgi:hypothetical protein